MHAEAREHLDNIVMRMHSGRLKRRTFIEQALTSGLSMGAAVSLLEACGEINTSCSPYSGTNKPNTIVWESEHDDQHIFGHLVDDFNKNHPGSHVIYRNDPFADRGQYDTTSKRLQTCSDAIDVVSIDVIWLSEFASKGWIYPLESTLATKVHTNYDNTKAAVETCTYEGTLYSVPLRVDRGILYYRQDLTPGTPPSTWDELIKQSRDLLKSQKVADGYVWQAATYEGLVCCFVELLDAYGGTILDPKDNRTVLVHKPEAVAALSTLLELKTISPSDITTYEEADARVRWQNNFALFMRNWYNALSIVTSPLTAVSESVRFTTLPTGNSTKSGSSLGRACIGGWQVGVNKSSKNPELAWQLIDALVTDKTIQSFVSSDIVSATDSEHAYKPSTLQEIRENVVSRPKTPLYNAISGKIQEHLSDALRAFDPSMNQQQRMSIATNTLSLLKNDLVKIIG